MGIGISTNDDPDHDKLVARLNLLTARADVLRDVWTRVLHELEAHRVLVTGKVPPPNVARFHELLMDWTKP